MKSGRTWFVVLVISAGAAIAVRETRMRRPETLVAPRQIQSPFAKKAVPFEDVALVGDYYFGDGRGVNCSLSIQEDYRFTFQWTGCRGENDKNEGTWKLVGDTVVVSPKAPNRHEGFKGMDTRFVPVVWKSRLYLVDEFQAPCFVARLEERSNEVYWKNNIHGLWYVLLEEGKPVMKAVDLPDYIPARFKEFMGLPPVKATVVTMASDSTVTIDKGSRSGLRTGLHLVGTSPAQDIELISVMPESATARVGYFSESTSEVKVGDEFATFGDFSKPRGTGWPRLTRPTAKPRP